MDVLTTAEAPKDARIVALILKSMGIDEFDPRVIHQLLEFMHQYTTNVFQDAQLYADHAAKPAIDLEDVRLAIQSRVNFSFTQPPPRELLLELAQKKNNLPLPIIPDKLGVLLPEDEHCLIAPNYQVNVAVPASSVPMSSEGAPSSRR